MTRSQAGVAVLECRGERPAWSKQARHLEVACWETQTGENLHQISEGYPQGDAGNTLPGEQTSGDTGCWLLSLMFTVFCGPRHTDHSRKPESESQEDKGESQSNRIAGQSIWGCEQGRGGQNGGVSMAPGFVGRNRHKELIFAATLTFQGLPSSCLLLEGLCRDVHTMNSLGARPGWVGKCRRLYQLPWDNSASEPKL